MTEAQLLQEISSLSPEAQKLVADLVRFLNRSSATTKTALPETKTSKRPLREEPFVGMWEDREDMKDSVEWVRNLRRTEWNRFTNDTD